MIMKTSKRRKQLLDLRTSVLETEEERLSGKPVMSILEVRKALAHRRISSIDKHNN